jgi:hypothetical protein
MGPQLKGIKSRYTQIKMPTEIAQPTKQAGKHSLPIPDSMAIVPQLFSVGSGNVSNISYNYLLCTYLLSIEPHLMATILFCF